MLPHEKIQKLHAAAITARLDRDALVMALDRRLVAQLPHLPNESHQLLSDLHELNRIDRLSDGSVPLEIWLQTAVTLAGPLPEGAVFEAILRELRGSQARPDGAPRPPRQEPWRAPPDASSSRDTGAAVSVYVAAAPQDARFVELLERHLAPQLHRGGDLRLWHRGKLLGGDDPSVADQEIGKADLALVFLSADAFIDETTYRDMNALIARMERGGLRVVPVLARSCDWESSPLGKLQPLPRDRRPIAMQRNADEAYVEVVRSISAIVKDVRANKRPASPPGDDGDEGFRSGSRDPRDLGATPREQPAPAGTPIEEIFRRQGIPELTYVEPEQSRGIRLALRTMGRGLVVEGPTQIGKSTVVRKALEGAKVQEIDCRHPRFRAKLQALLDAWDLEGHLVIEDAHLIPADLLGELARFMRWLADVPRPRGKVTLLGINRTGRRLVAGQRDLAGRIDEVRMQRQPDEKIRELIEKGERIANVRFARKEEMVREARGSFRLAQELCFQVLVHAPPGAPSPPAEVVATRRKVEAGPDDVRAKMREALDIEFEERLFDFVSADRDKPSPAEATPGGCFALLWRLAEGERMRAPVGEAKRMFANLDPAFRWIEGGGLESFLQEHEPLAELLSCAAGELTAQDPRLDYYLSVLDWKHLAQKAGIDVDLQGGDLVFGVPGSNVSARRQHTTSILKLPEYPWGNPKAVRLRDLLMGAYPEPETAVQLARTASIDLRRVPLQGAIETVWNGILESASRQAALEPLLRNVLADKKVKAYWPSIEECVPELRAPQPVPAS